MLRNAVFILAVDIVTKIWPVTNLEPAPVNSSPGLFSLVLYRNCGLPFSLLKKYPYASLAISLAGVCCLAIFSIRAKRFHSSFGISLLWAGALGNLIDRVIYGSVVDWIYFGVYFNIADIALCAGGLLLLFQYGRRS